MIGKLTSGVLSSFPSSERSLVWLGHRFPRSRIVSNLWFFAGEAMARKGGNLNRIATVAGGAKVHLSLTESLFRMIYFSGSHEQETSKLLCELVGPGEVWVDAGANIGVFTMAMAKLVGSEGKVFAYEPHPRLAESIRRSVIENGFSNVDVRAKALGAEPGEGTLYIPSQPDETPGGSGRCSLLLQSSVENSIAQEVKVVRLDEDLPKETVIYGIKIDVEGFEKAAIAGMSSILMARPPSLILFEASRLPEALATPEELLAIVDGYGYDCFDPTTRRRLCDREVYRGGMCDNLLAVHRSAADVRARLKLHPA